MHTSDSSHHRSRSARFVSRLLAVALALPMLAAHAGGGARGAPTGEERWYVIRMLGQNAGWMREMETLVPSGEAGAPPNIRSESELRLKVGRAEASIEVVVVSEVVESPTGAPIRMRSEQRLGALPLVSEYVWREGAVDITETQSGRDTKRSEPWPPRAKAGGDAPNANDAPADDSPILAPAAATRAFDAAAAEGKREFRARVLDPMSGLTPVAVVRTLRDDLGDKAEAFGKVVPAKAWSVTQSVTPGAESVEWIDDGGRLVRGDTSLGGLSLTLLRADKETALLPVDGPELMASTLVTPNRPIERPRETSKAVYLVRVTEGELPDLPSTASQKFERIDAKSGRVTVGERVGGLAEVGDIAPYLASTVMIGADDPAVQALAKTSVPDHEMKTVTIAVMHGPSPSWWKDTANKGLPALRKNVAEHITAKNLDVGFATASEVARTRTGDCTEHAMLLAAVLRAAKFPSRCATGLVYVDDFAGEKGVFGFHMWAQTLTRAGPLPGAGLPHDNWAWIDQDATLPERAFDAAHIALAVTAMGDEDRVNALASIAPLIGRLQIEVESVEYDPPPPTRPMR